MNNNHSNGQTSDSEHAQGAIRRGSEALSGLAALSTLLISLSNDLVSATWLLWLSTSLCAAFLVVAFAIKRPPRGTRSFGAFVAAFGGSALLLSAAWLFAFRDEIRFSKLVTQFLSGPSVLVDGSISRAMLVSKGSGESTQRLVAFVNSIVEGSHRTRICTPRDCADPEVAFAINGLVMENTFALEFTLPAKPAQGSASAAPKDARELLANIDSAEYFLRNELNRPEGPIRFEGTLDVIREVILAGYHLASAVRMMEASDTVSADMHLSEFQERAGMLVRNGQRDWVLEGVLLAAEHAVSKHDLRDAQRTVGLGLKLLPGSARLQVAEAYLRLGSHTDTKANEAVSEADVKELSNVALFHVLRAVIAARAGEYWEASTYFELGAKQHEVEATEDRFRLHTAAALFAALSEAAPSLRGPRILSNVQIASTIHNDVPLLGLLTAFGHALNDSRANAEKLFDRLEHARDSDQAAALWTYWRGRAYAEYGELEAASSVLEKVASDHRSDPQTRGLYADVLLRLELERAAEQARMVELPRLSEAVKFAKSALQRDANEPKANRVLGLYKAWEGWQLPRAQREALATEAQVHLGRAVAGGAGDSYVHEVLSEVYRDLSDAGRARQSARKSLELQCSLGGKELACRVKEIVRLLDAKEKTQAESATNDMFDFLTDNPRVSNGLERSEMLIQAAVAWYEYKSLENAQILYRNVHRELDKLPQSFRVTQTRAQVDCNMGFVHFDRGQTEDALRAFQRSLQVQRDADCEAGLAIALQKARRTPEALVEYRRARARDASYGDDLRMVQLMNYWSEIAVETLRELADQDRRARTEVSRGTTM